MKYLYEEWLYYQRGIIIATLAVDKNDIFIINTENKVKYNNELNSGLVNPERYLKIIAQLESNGFNNDVILDEENVLYRKSLYRKTLQGDIYIWKQRKFEPGIVDILSLNKEIFGFVGTNGNGSEYLVKKGHEEFSPIVEWTDEKLSPSGRGRILKGSYMVEMKDGTKLATDVWIPADYRDEERLPAILIRTPYGRKKFEKRESLYAERGYAVVLQDVRGREESEGEFIAAYYEKTDGNDTLNWIAEQSWSDANIGMIGGSYSGFVQWAAAASGNKNLKAIVSMVAAGSNFVDLDRRGGAYHMSVMDWNVMMSEKSMTMKYDDVNWEEKFKIRPIRNIPESVTGFKIPFWEKYMEHPNYDEFWEEMDFEAFSKNIDVPALVISGWHDGDLNGTTQIWEMNKKNKRKNQRLIIGPWEHHYNARRHTGELELGDNAVIYNMDILYLKWFDRFLKNINNDVETEKAEYYVEGLNKWKTSKRWPPEKSKLRIFYLNKSELEISYIMEEKFKVAGKNEPVPYVEYEYDPMNPAPQLFDQITKKPFAPVDYTGVEKRADVISFYTGTFQDDCIVAGSQKLVFFASSSALDTDWVARITLVTEEGKSIRLTDQIIRAKYRKSFKEAELLSPGRIYRFDISFPYFAHLVKKGEGLKLEITSSQYGEIFPNPNTGNDQANDIEFVKATQKIYCGKRYSSKLYVKLYGERGVKIE